MVKKLKVKAKKVKKEKVSRDSGMDLDDAFGDDDDVEYAESKPKKVKKVKKGKKAMDEIENELGDAEESVNDFGDSEDVKHQIKASKPIGKIKKGDRITIDGSQYEVDSHYCMIDHGSTKEMAIELFDPKTDKDYQLRYFDDQANSTLEFYELQEILYIKKQFIKIGW